MIQSLRNLSQSLQTPPTTPTRVNSTSKQTEGNDASEKSTNGSSSSNGSTAMPRNEIVLKKEIDALLNGVQSVSSGFYGEHTRSRIINVTNKTASVADNSCLSIEKKLNQSMGVLNALQIKHNEMDRQVEDIVSNGKNLGELLKELRIQEKYGLIQRGRYLEGLSTLVVSKK